MKTRAQLVAAVAALLSMLGRSFRAAPRRVGRALLHRPALFFSLRSAKEAELGAANAAPFLAQPVFCSLHLVRNILQ